MYFRRDTLYSGGKRHSGILYINSFQLIEADLKIIFLEYFLYCTNFWFISERVRNHFTALIVFTRLHIKNRNITRFTLWHF